MLLFVLGGGLAGALLASAQADPDASRAGRGAEEDCGAVSAAPPAAPAAAESLPGHAKLDFALQFADEVSPYRLMSTTLLPGKTLEVEAVLTDRGTRFEAEADAGRLERLGPERWRWTAPEQPGGPHSLRVTDLEAREVAHLQLFVLQPYEGEDTLEGYRIGRYQEVPLHGDPGYHRPPGFVRVTAENATTRVSPHFQLGQFVAKQAGDYPKFLALSSRLLIKLELLLERVRGAGVEASTFAILSGYRTPFYNASIGNRTRYSRHTYGDAADIYIDEDGDGRMDDLDGDGAVTRRDAQLLFELIDGLYDETWYHPFVGGLGLYGPAPHRGPFVHVDTRGRRARW